jgi:hypothetical protein
MIEKKTDDRTNPKNWRPISITSCLMRLFEKIILYRLNKHLQQNNLIISNQSGFRKRRSTQDNLLFVTQKAYECFNRGWSMLSIFFDIEGAFDKVWHEGLIYKLAKIKTPLYILNFVMTILDGRRFRVKVENCHSEFYEIKCGVPQGGVLSPTLFSVMVNDSPQKNAKNREKTLLFADDKNYNIMFKKFDERTHKKIGSYVNELETWAKNWRFTLAP